MEFELCLLPSASSIEFSGPDAKPRISSLYGVANATRRIWLKARELNAHQHALSLLARRRGVDETTPSILTLTRTQRDGPYATMPLLDRGLLTEPPMDPRRLRFNDHYALLLKQNEVTFFEAMYCVLGLDRRILGLDFRRRREGEEDDTAPGDDTALLLSAGRSLDQIAWVPQKRSYRETDDAVIVVITPPGSPPVDFAAVANATPIDEPPQEEEERVVPDPEPQLDCGAAAAAEVKTKHKRLVQDHGERKKKKRQAPSVLDPDRIVEWARSSLRSDALQDGSCLSACVMRDEDDEQKKRRGAPRKVPMHTVVALVDRIVAETLGASSSSQPEKPTHIIAEASGTEALGAAASEMMMMAPLPPSELPSFGLLGDDADDEPRIGVLSDTFSPLPPFTPSEVYAFTPIG